MNDTMNNTMNNDTMNVRDDSILVVEDDPGNLRLLDRMLTRAGYVVRPVGGGALALRSASSKPPGLILLDIKLPGMDGYELCRRFKAGEETRDIPIIFLSALGGVSDKMRGFEVGAVDYITKPFYEPEVLARVKTHLELRRARRQLEIKNRQMLEEIAFRKEIAEQLKANEEKLEDRVRERTAELETYKSRLEQLVGERTRSLKAVNQELEQFAYVVSHDLKAPLRGISHLSRWLLEDYGSVLDADGLERLNMIIERVRHLYELIDGILQYSRIGRFREKKTRIDPLPLVNEVLRVLAPPDNITITVKPPMPTIRGDRTRISQVFQNLIGNAVKFMDKEKGIITIGHRWWRGQGYFYVRDNGPGIDAKDRDKIFGVFQSLGSSRVFASTGIGLALVKKIVETYGGNIQVKSVPGKGSTFYFNLATAEEKPGPG